MKWFKHYHNSSTSNELNEIIDDLGLEGYARYWLLLELLTEKFDGESTTFKIHFSEISAKVRIKFRKKLATFLQKLSKSSVTFTGVEGNFYKIEAPILLDLMDRDFKKTRKKREEPAPKNKDKRIKKKNKNSPVAKIASGAATEVKPSFEIRCAYESAYQDRYGIKPSWGAPEYNLANRLLKSLPKSEVLTLVQKYLSYNDPWHLGKKHPFKLFYSDIDKIRVELNNPNRMLDAKIAERELGDVVQIKTRERGDSELERMRKEVEGEPKAIPVSS